MVYLTKYINANVVISIAISLNTLTGNTVWDMININLKFDFPVNRYIWTGKSSWLQYEPLSFLDWVGYQHRRVNMTTAYWSASKGYTKRLYRAQFLTHWGRVTHICVDNITIIGPDNCLSPGRRQAIIWTNAGILSIGPLGTNFSENLIEILTFSFTKMRLKVSSAKWRPFCLGLNVLTHACL